MQNVHAILLITGVGVGCADAAVDEATTTGDGDTADMSEIFAPTVYPWADAVVVHEERAFEIAASELGEDFRTTSALFGPRFEGENSFPTWVVTVTDGTALFEVVIDAIDASVVRVELRSVMLSGEDAEDLDPYAYFTSCPSGWPLCIRNPSRITFYSQNDTSWKSHQLGYDSRYTIGSDGCLLSSYAMQLKQKGFVSKNPDDTNTYGQNHGCFSSGTSLLKRNSCLARGRATYREIGVDDVWGRIAAGTPVVVYGLHRSWGTNHAQMIWGHDGARYWTKDPWYDWTNQDQPMTIGTSRSSPSFRVFE